MKLIIAEYEVEIKAHSRFNARNNKNDVCHLLNEISIICDGASRESKDNGYNSLSERYYELGNDIYKTLKEMGFYGK